MCRCNDGLSVVTAMPVRFLGQQVYLCLAVVLCSAEHAAQNIASAHGPRWPAIVWPHVRAAPSVGQRQRAPRAQRRPSSLRATRHNMKYFLEYFVAAFVAPAYYWRTSTAQSPPMTYITRDDAHALLQPYFADFSTIVEAAWSDWRTSTVAAQMQHKRFRANYVWNQLITHAKRQFDGHPKVSIQSLKDWDGILIEESVFIRMKKGDSALLSRNYPTQSALNFNNPVRDLFGGIARLELLYVLGDAEADVERIALVQRNGRTLSWAIDVVGEGNAASNIELFSKDTDGGDNCTAADRVIKPKSDKRQRKDETQNGSA